MRTTAKVIACVIGFAFVSECHRAPVAQPSAPDVDPETRAASNATGATDVLSGDIADREQLQDVATYLEGRVPGLSVTRYPNGDISLRIRGAVSLNGASSEPLVVVDGMPVASSSLSLVFRGLNPHDIESIKVLRDVASTSGYGMQGAHGVILIETKR